MISNGYEKFKKCSFSRLARQERRRAYPAFQATAIMEKAGNTRAFPAPFRPPRNRLVAKILFKSDQEVPLMPERVSPGPLRGNPPPREAVCIHTRKVYDSCRDKECLQDLRVYLTASSQAILESAINVKPQSAKLLWTYIDVEPISYNRGFYTVDVKYFYRVDCDAFSGVGRLRQRGQRPDLQLRLCVQRPGHPEHRAHQPARGGGGGGGSRVSGLQDGGHLLRQLHQHGPLLRYPRGYLQLLRRGSGDLLRRPPAVRHPGPVQHH